MLPIALEGTWGFVALGTALVFIAFLINRLAPQRRRRIRHVVFLYLCFLLCGGIEHLLAWLARSHATLSPWVEHVHLASALASALTSVSLGALLVFDFVLPVLGVSIVAITGDLLVGLAYAFAALGVLRAEGFSPSSVVTTSAIVSGVIALSLQATLGNILGGVALQLDGSFDVGDWLQLPDGQQGQVVAIRWLAAVEPLELFHSMTPDERNYVADHLRYAPFTAGETITRQGAEAHFLYILCTGEVEVRRHGDAAAQTVKVVAHLRAPGFFGEMGLLTGEPRGADVVALTDIECYRLDKEGLERLLHERPEIAEELSRTVAKRQVEMGAIRVDLDAQAHAANMVKEQINILDKIQRFFGLARTSIS
jgi:CRP-like cAMP-binding protein